MRLSAWFTIAREMIIQILTQQCGLQLKLTSNSSFIFCRVRAPIKLLELQADKEDYPLQLRGEIDPGSEEFWNFEINGVPVEIEEENRLYTIQEGKKILENLYKAKKISAIDLNINPEEETQVMFSRRIHALERMADQVPITNQYVPYAPYVCNKPHLRYLFQTYPSIRGQTLFRSKDRLILTKSIIDKSIDLQVLIQSNVIISFLLLHDANRGEKLTIDYLARKWVKFWNTYGIATKISQDKDEESNLNNKTQDKFNISSGNAKDSIVNSVIISRGSLCAPFVTHPAYDDEDYQLPFYLLMFSQPLKEIREYFGEKIGLYYCWLGYFTYALIIPAVAGLILDGIYFIRGSQVSTVEYDYVSYIYLFVIISWAMWFDLNWNRESRLISIKWGTKGFESKEKDRSEFVPDKNKPIQRSIINNYYETYYPESKRQWHQYTSYGVIFLLVLLDVFIIYMLLFIQTMSSFFFFERNLSSFPLLYFYWISYFIIVCLTQLTSYYFFNYIAISLNNYENYRTDTEYEDSLVNKMMVFEFFNSILPCYFIGFGKNWIFDDLRKELFNEGENGDLCYDNCIVELRMFLYCIIIFRVIHAFWIMFVTYLEAKFQWFRNFRQASSRSSHRKKSFFYNCICFFKIFNSGHDSSNEEENQPLLISSSNFNSSNVAINPFATVDAANPNNHISGTNTNPNHIIYEEDNQFISEVNLREFHGIFYSSYTLFSQFAYINLFSIIIPILPLITLLENCVMIRISAYKLCHLYRRPFVELAEDCGKWESYMKYTIFLGIYTTIGFLTLSYPDLYTYSLYQKFIIFFVVSQLLILYLLVVQSYFNSNTEQDIDLIIQRQDYIIDKFVKGFNDEFTLNSSSFVSQSDTEASGEALSANKEGQDPNFTTTSIAQSNSIQKLHQNLIRLTEQRGHIDDQIDMDLLYLSPKSGVNNENPNSNKETDQSAGILSNMIVTDEELALIEQLESQRRDLLKEIKFLKEKLNELYKTEIFNEHTGIGETKHGLPLGRIAIKLIEIKDLQIEAHSPLSGAPSTGVLDISTTTLASNLAFSSKAANTTSSIPFKIRIEIKSNSSVHKIAPVSNLTSSLTDSSVYYLPNKSGNVSLNQAMGPYAPIRTIHADVVFHLIQILDPSAGSAKGNELNVGNTFISLSELQDQAQHDLVLKFKLRDSLGYLQNSTATLFVNMIFQYSKVIPIRNSIYLLQDKLYSTEKELVLLKSGKHKL